MHKILFKVPDNLVEEWPEVFEDVWIDTVPVSYLHSLQIEFKNGRIWEFTVREKLTNQNAELISSKIKEMISEYHSTIRNVNLQLDVPKLKEDIKVSTKNIF